MAAHQPTITLTAEQRRSFLEDGYLVLDRMTKPEEVESFRRTFARLFSEKAGRAEGAHIDMMTTDDENAPARLPSIIRPVNYAPELRDTLYRANAFEVARQLLGPEVTEAFEHAILKPPRHGSETPWHQDEATRFDPNFHYEQISFWMPLCEATPENGCMEYIPGTHRQEILPHRSPGDDPRVHAIECAGGFDPADAVKVPMSAGAAVLHHGRTLHHAGPNSTDAERCAYILAFELPPRPRDEPRDFPWNREKRTAGLERKRVWRRKGGIVVESLRKLRDAGRSPKRMLFELRRGARVVFGRR